MEAAATNLVPVAALPGWLRGLFPYAHFNAMQSNVFDSAFNSDHSLVVAAPTGSGKTVVLELAIARLWHAAKAAGAERPASIYMAPLKALTHGARYATPAASTPLSWRGPAPRAWCPPSDMPNTVVPSTDSCANASLYGRMRSPLACPAARATG